MSETQPQAPSFTSLRSKPPGQNGSEVFFVLSLKAYGGDSSPAWSGAHTCTSGGAPAVPWPGSWRKAVGAGQATAMTSVTPPGPAAGAAKMSRLFSLCSHCSQPRVGERADNQGATGQGHICPQKKPEEALQAREAEYYRGEGWDKSNPVRAWPSGAAQGRLPDGAASSTQERRESMRAWQATLGKGVHLVCGRVQCSSSYVFVILGIEKNAVQNK